MCTSGKLTIGVTVTTVYARVYLAVFVFLSSACPRISFLLACGFVLHAAKLWGCRETGARKTTCETSRRGNFAGCNGYSRRPDDLCCIILLSICWERFYQELYSQLPPDYCSEESNPLIPSSRVLRSDTVNHAAGAGFTPPIPATFPRSYCLCLSMAVHSLMQHSVSLL